MIIVLFVQSTYHDMYFNLVTRIYASENEFKLNTCVSFSTAYKYKLQINASLSQQTNVFFSLWPTMIDEVACGEEVGSDDVVIF